MFGVFHAKLNLILAKLDQLITIQNAGVKLTMATLQDIANAVAAEATVEQSAITLLNELTAAVQAALNGGDAAALQSVLTEIQTNTAALSAAVVANTPAAPAPAPGTGAPTP